MKDGIWSVSRASRSEERGALRGGGQESLAELCQGGPEAVAK